MVGKDKTQVFSNVPIALKERLKALTRIDKVVYSESRVVWQCVEMGLPTIEKQAASSPFSHPAQPAPGRPRKLRRV